MTFENLGWIIVVDGDMDRICYDSRKEAEREVEGLKWCDMILGERHKYDIISERTLVN